VLAHLSARQETLDGGFPTNTTLDQLIARQIGSECTLPSLELSTNDFADNKETRYFESISWYAPGYAANTEKNPRAVFQRLFGQGRGGPTQSVLGMAAIHFMGGNGERTSPVERGAWVLRKLLHDPPPPAPANVPAITRLAGKVLTTHERLLAHQEDPQCASCHRKIDPIGFGLENFDAAGQWRTEDSYTALDANGKPDPKSKKT
jgi:hypothetical protein